MSIPKPYMPDVDALAPERLAQIFNTAYKVSAEGSSDAGNLPKQRCVVLLTPGRLARPLMAPPPGSMSAANVQAINALLPPPAKRVAAIGFTANLLQAGMPDISAAIPFLGFLIGFAYIG